MKKDLSYVAIAILLGTVIMLAPIMLIKPASSPAPGDGEGVPEGLPKLPRYCPCPEVEAGAEKGFVVNETLGRTEALERTLCPSNLSSAGLMLIPSFFLALGVSLYLKKRTF